MTVLNSLVVANPPGTVRRSQWSARGDATLTARGSTFVARGPVPEAGIRLACTYGPGNAAGGPHQLGRPRARHGQPADQPGRQGRDLRRANLLTTTHSSYDTVTTDPVFGTATATPAGFGTDLIGDRCSSISPGDSTLQVGSPLIKHGDPAVVLAGGLDAAGARAPRTTTATGSRPRTSAHSSAPALPARARRRVSAAARPTARVSTGHR